MSTGGKRKFAYSLSFLKNRITADWNEQEGWLAPEIRPYENLSLAPSAVVFHYASEVSLPT
jgi:branched-chain amino acid aminotransferase